jgi:hypothetical protein
LQRQVGRGGWDSWRIYNLQIISEAADQKSRSQNNGPPAEPACSNPEEGELVKSWKTTDTGLQDNTEFEITTDGCLTTVLLWAAATRRPGARSHCEADGGCSSCQGEQQRYPSPVCLA